jgi:serine/threonine protein kinase
MAIGLYVLNRQGLGHFDIKPENIFVDGEANVKLGLFFFYI